MLFSLTGNFRLTQNRDTFACGEGSENTRGHSSPSSSPGTNRDLCSANCHRGTVMVGHCLRTIQQMGMFADTANVHYHLLFAKQRKNVSMFRFLLVVFFVNMDIKTAVYTGIYIHSHSAVSNRTRKPRQFSLICFLFAKELCCLSVCLLMFRTEEAGIFLRSSE